MKTMTPLRSPYPWFGGKAAVAGIVWKRLGDVRNFVEPFFGSGAMLLARPHWPFQETRIETVNDKDCFVANFWRALQADPEAVAYHCDWPVNEKDLRDRHNWLCNSPEVVEWRAKMLENDRVGHPDFYDAKIAGWWVWGLCQWIGDGWCSKPEWQPRPHLGNAGNGVHRPHLGDGRGVHRPRQKLPHLGDGRGVHRPRQKLPHLRSAGMGVHRPRQQRPHLGSAGMGDIYEYLAALADRMRNVRVCCGDWSRVCGPTPTIKMGLTAVFLDPPYNADAGRATDIYAVDDLSVSNDVREWCKEMGGDKRMRICLAGYAGEGHEELESLGWDVVEWKAHGGYGNQSDGDGRENTRKERLWFSPHCIKPATVRTLF